MYDIQSLLATFLHELSHCITPMVLVKKDNGWYAQSHSENFYKNFAKILKKAEELKIFILPPQTNKFGQRSLERFDSLDTEAAPLPSSSSPLYANSVNTSDSKRTTQTNSTNDEEASINFQTCHSN